MIYLDNAATTKVSQNVICGLNEWLGDIRGNASSIHTSGSKSREKIDEARLRVAELISATPKEIYFTSGGTESNNIAISGMITYLTTHNKCVLVGATEHHSVLNTCYNLRKFGITVLTIPVNTQGEIDYEWVEKTSSEYDVGLLCAMCANNETGTMNDIERIGNICREHNIFFHCDAVQAVGHIKIDVEKSNISSLSISGHKIHSIQGVGALYIRKGSPVTSIMYGGNQESKIRPGTENVVGIISLGLAVKEYMGNCDNFNAYVKTLKFKLLSRLLRTIPCETTVDETKQNILSNIISIRMPLIDSESLMLLLDTFDIYVSAGSACTAGSPAPSHVLKAMGISNENAKETIRISLSRYNTRNDIDIAANSILKAYTVLNGLNGTLKAGE